MKGVSLAQNWIDKHKNSRRDECMIWPFSKDRHGRAKIGFKGAPTQHVARIMCEAYHGPAPSVAHRAIVICENAKIGCCAPAHTRWMTPAECTKAIWERGRFRNETGNRGRITPMEVDRLRYLRDVEKLSYHDIEAKTGTPFSTLYYWLDGRRRRGHDQGPLTTRRAAGLLTQRESLRLGVSWPRRPVMRRVDADTVMARVFAIVPRDTMDREAICNEIIADYLTGDISFDEITPALARHYKNKLIGMDFEKSGYGVVSLDFKPDGQYSLHERIAAQ